jgi:hygromycin-B 7''-O-kinase
MSSFFPPSIDEHGYWQRLYKQPIAFWQSALDSIRHRHQLPSGAWERSAFGKNVVFTLGAVVVKLSPPFWVDDLRNEAAILRFVAHRLPVATPELLADGELEAWGYLVLSRLPGEPLRLRWPLLAPSEKAVLAPQQGALMAALHALPTHDAPTRLVYDWTARLAEQMAICEPAMRRSGVQAPLLAEIGRYLAQAQPLLLAETERVLLHGDLDAGNLLVEHQSGQWRISGLFDWGDGWLGPRTHDFISPGVHRLGGDPESLQAWYAGYGLAPEQRTRQLQHTVMARAMLHYADEWARMMARVPGADSCRDWFELADCFWHMTIP